MKTISMTVWRRPEYTRMVLDALAANLGSGEYRLVVAVDVTSGPDREVMHILGQQHWPAKLEVHVAPAPRGCNGNTRAALRAAFAPPEVDYVIHVEDDILLAADALAWFEWAHRAYREDPSVFTVTAWRHPDGWLPETGKPQPPAEVWGCRREWFFTCWGWATWRDRWEEMDDRWTLLGDHDHDGSWDVRVSQIRGARQQLAPLVSRAVNIGAMGGTHRGHEPLSYWRGMDEIHSVLAFQEA